MRDAVVRLGLQPDALQQSVAELKPGRIANAQQNRPRRRAFDTAWQAVPCDTVPRPDGRLAVRPRKKSAPCPPFLKKAELSHRLRAKPTCPGVPWRDLQFPFRVSLPYNRMALIAEAV